MQDDISDRDKLFMDMYADIQTIKDGVGKLEKTSGEHSDSIISIQRDIHAVKMSGRLIKWTAALIGAIAALATKYFPKIMGNP